MKKIVIMKNSIQLIVLLFVATLLTSCNEEEFLKESPKDNLYADNLSIT